MSGLNDPSFFRKGGLLVDGAPDQHTEVGRDPLTGNWYIDINGRSGHVRAILTPDKAFRLFKGGLIAMARFQPQRLGEIRSLLQALLPHA